MTRILIIHTWIKWWHEQKWDRTPWLLEYQNIFSFGGFVRFDFYPLAILSDGAFVHFGISLCAHVIAWWECWLSTPVSCDHMNRNGIVHLDCWSIKIFSLLGVLSALIFILWFFCPIVLLSILAFLCPPTWSHDDNFDCPHLYHVITWTEMLSYTLTVGVLKYFSFGGFVRFGFYPFGIFSYGVFVHFGISLSAHMIAWRECWLSTPVLCDHMNRNRIVHLDCCSIKIFSLFSVLSDLMFILWGFCPMVLWSILAFLCPLTCSHDKNVDCPHLYHVITWTEIWSYTLIVGVLKYFLFWGFCKLWFL